MHIDFHAITGLLHVHASVYRTCWSLGPTTVKIEESNNQYLQLCFYIQGRGETTPTLVTISTMKTIDKKHFSVYPILLK